MLLLQRMLLIMIGGLLCTFPAVSQDTDQIKGDWLGKLNLPGSSLRIVFHISENEKGELASTMDSPDQGANGIVASETSFSEGNLVVKVATIGGEYNGVLEGELLKGTWSQGGGSLPLELERMTEPITYNRPQEPERPFPYIEEVVRYKSADGDFELEGTLTLPNGDGKFPAVVLISGSGPQDRDEALMGHKPFLVLSDYLTRQGIAVLRYDDRGVGNSGGDFGTATTLDFATDVTAAIGFLESRSDIDSKAIGLVGHSEGGLIAPIVAHNADNNVAFSVLLAGPGLSGKDVLLTQSEEMLRKQGMGDEFVEKISAVNARLYETVLSSEEGKVEENLRLELTEIRKDLSDMEKTMMGLTEERAGQIVSQLSSTWMQEFMRIDPTTYLKQMKAPVLSLIGDKDVQVLAKENSEAIEKALQQAGNQDYEVKIISGKNHLFQEANTGLPAEYTNIEETFSEEVMELIAEWIKERV